MYGIFFEEINHAGEGGLYAELIQNRSFEDKELPEDCYVKNGMLYHHTSNQDYNKGLKVA